MRRRLRRVLLAVVVLALVAAPVVFAATARPGLEDARDRVDDRWADLRPGLVERYSGLASATEAVAEAGVQAEVVAELEDALDEWSVRRREEDPEAEVQAANTLEGLGARLALVAGASPRLQADPGVTFALGVYGNHAPDPELVTAYSESLDAYDDERNDPLRAPLASVFGFEGRNDFAPAV